MHVIATKRAVRRTRVFKRRTLQHSVTPCGGSSRLPYPYKAHISSTGAPYDPTPCGGRSKPLPYNIRFVCFAFARHCNQTCGTSNTRVQAPYPTALCNALPRVVEAPTPTKRTSPQPTLLMIQRPAAGGASPSPTPFSTFHFPFSTFNFPLTILPLPHSIRCSERKHGR